MLSQPHHSPGIFGVNTEKSQEMDRDNTSNNFSFTDVFSAVVMQTYRLINIFFFIFRMFDSQNNNRGGYNVGSEYFYVGSELGIEWTNQHSCGEVNNHCEIVVQYMCDSRIRDGARTT